jgi:hypothetical protein
MTSSWESTVIQRTSLFLVITMLLQCVPAGCLAEIRTRDLYHGTGSHDQRDGLGTPELFRLSRFECMVTVDLIQILSCLQYLAAEQSLPARAAGMARILKLPPRPYILQLSKTPIRPGTLAFGLCGPIKNIAFPHFCLM